MRQVGPFRGGLQASFKHQIAAKRESIAARRYGGRPGKKEGDTLTTANAFVSSMREGVFSYVKHDLQKTRTNEKEPSSKNLGHFLKSITPNIKPYWSPRRKQSLTSYWLASGRA